MSFITREKLDSTFCTFESCHKYTPSMEFQYVIFFERHSNTV